MPRYAKGSLEEQIQRDLKRLAAETRTNGRASRAHRLERIQESLAPMREHRGEKFTDEEVSRLISGIHVLVRHHPEQGDMITATLLLKLLKMQAKR